jgi:peptidyl-prolyl cis-trans isomerase SurA
LLKASFPIRIETYRFTFEAAMKKAVLLFTLIFSVAIVSAQSARLLVDRIAGTVGDKIVLRSDIVNYIDDMKRQGQEAPPNAECFLLERMMSDKALVLQAEKDSLPVSDEEIEAELDQRIRYFVNQYGGKEALEMIAGRTVFQMKEDFRQTIKERRLADAMRQKIVGNIKITPNEVKIYFDKIPKDSLYFYETELVVGQIVVYPKAGRELEKFAQDELLDYKRQVESGQKSFETMAKLYSDEPGAKQGGGRIEMNKGEKVWDPDFKNAAFRLKEGQISPVIKSKFGYHIIQLVSRNGDDIVVRHILRIPTITEPEIAEARAKLDSVRARLITGGINFGEAVDKYSDDETSKFTAGYINGKDGTTVTIDELDKDLVKDLGNLKIGQYSQPVEFSDERGKKGVRIIYLQNRLEPHRENMKDDYNKIANRAIEEKKQSALEKWFHTKLPTYYIMVSDEYRDCEGIKRQFPNIAIN